MARGAQASAAITNTEVLVVGAGPTGLLLAGELAQAGIDVKLLERRDHNTSNLTRSFTVHARTLEQLDARDIAEAIIATGTKLDTLPLFGGLHMEFSGLRTRFPFVLVTPQFHVERVLEQRARDAGVVVQHGVDVIDLRQDADGIELDVQDDSDSITTHRADYVVGTDGVRSTIRRLLGISFPGDSILRSVVLADVRLAEAPPDLLTVHANSQGFVFVAPFGDDWFRVLAWSRTNQRSDEAPVHFEELRDLTSRILGTDYGMHAPRWLSRFHSDERQASQYRVGRAFLAGDAAHVHSPAGGMGMNIGLQDAMNLGWKLAAAIRSRSESTLLDTYQDECHRVGSRALRTSGALVRAALAQSGRTRLAQQLMLWCTRHLGGIGHRIGQRVGRDVSGTGIAYYRKRGNHRFVGQHFPDVWLIAFHEGTPGNRQTTRLHETLRTDRFVLLTSDSAIRRTVGDWSCHVIVAEPINAQRATVLIRPDGYVAWAADHPDPATVRSVLGQWVAPAGSTDLVLEEPREEA